MAFLLVELLQMYAASNFLYALSVEMIRKNVQKRLFSISQGCFIITFNKVYNWYVFQR
jgi:hypothetical protein